MKNIIKNTLVAVQKSLSNEAYFLPTQIFSYRIAIRFRNRNMSIPIFPRNGPLRQTSKTDAFCLTCSHLHLVLESRQVLSTSKTCNRGISELFVFQGRGRNPPCGCIFRVGIGLFTGFGRFSFCPTHIQTTLVNVQSFLPNCCHTDRCFFPGISNGHAHFSVSSCQLHLRLHCFCESVQPVPPSRFFFQNCR